ncbi:MAG: GNAT family N-acetyltransferase [Bacteroidaceae bacterium]|jgi:RimJ/RimL family protein N-acetyltransferase|nr:GNAT family N-acetyltransferase [Bacteroidaceae bacterium]
MEKTVYFRAFQEEDAELIYQWRNDDDLKKLSIGLNRRMCREEALDWVRARMRHNDYRVFWAICSKKTDKMIGYACLTDIHYINSSANLSGIMIGDKDYQDGLAWIETYLFIYEYVFERLNLNRIYGHAIDEHLMTIAMREAMFSVREGVMRQAAFKNGRYYDVSIGSILRDEYFAHKANGDYEMSAVLKRLTKAIRRLRNNSSNSSIK